MIMFNDKVRRNMRGKKKKILIVDDDFASRRLVEQIIRSKFTCDISHAQDGSEGLQTMLREAPDLVILDMVMPFMNGMQVLETMKRSAKLSQIPVIACTAVGDTSVAKQIISYGVKHYIVKPIDKNTLVEKVSIFVETSDITS